MFIMDYHVLTSVFSSSPKYLRSQVFQVYLLFGQSCRLLSALLVSADQVAPRDGTLTWSTKDNLLV